MELRREEIENKANNTIYKNYSLLFKKLYKDYEYLEIEHHSFNAIVLDEIEKSKATYKEKEIYSVYIKDRINERMISYITKYLEDDDKMSRFINNYIKYNVTKQMTDDYIIYYLTRLDEFFTSINYIPNPDVALEVINNEKLNEILRLYLKHNLMGRKKYNSGITSLISTYRDIYNPDINIHDDSIDDKSLGLDCDGLTTYFNEIKKIPPLTINEEKKYGYELLNGSKEARDILIKHNLKLVVSIAKKYMGLGVQLIDMIQDGNEGLIMAVNKFNINKGCLFSTYAGWWIRHRILRALSANRKAIRITEESYYKLSKYYQEVNKLRNKLNREPKDAEVAESLNISIKELNEIKSFDHEIISLNATSRKCDNKENELLNVIALREESIEDKHAIKYLSKELRYLFKACNLTDREMALLTLRYGLDGEGPRTLEEVGEVLGQVSRERMRQVEGKALMKIRNSDHIEEFAIYMDNPDKAMEHIKIYRKKYQESPLNYCKANLIDEEGRGFTYNNIVNETRRNKVSR